VPSFKSGPWPRSTGRGGLSCTVAEQPCGPRSGGLSNGEIGPWRGVAARAGHAHGLVTACSLRVGRHAGAFVGGSVAASWRQGVAGELAGGHREDVGQGGGGRGAPERWIDGEAAQAAAGRRCSLAVG
jgi:hypothetical protein